MYVYLLKFTPGCFKTFRGSYVKFLKEKLLKLIVIIMLLLFFQVLLAHLVLRLGHFLEDDPNTKYQIGCFFTLRKESEEMPIVHTPPDYSKFSGYDIPAISITSVSTHIMNDELLIKHPPTVSEEMRLAKKKHKPRKHRKKKSVSRNTISQYISSSEPSEHNFTQNFADNFTEPGHKPEKEVEVPLNIIVSSKADLAEAFIITPKGQLEEMTAKVREAGLLNLKKLQPNKTNNQRDFEGSYKNEVPYVMKKTSLTRRKSKIDNEIPFIILTEAKHKSDEKVLQVYEINHSHLNILTPRKRAKRSKSEQPKFFAHSRSKKNAFQYNNDTSKQDDSEKTWKNFLKKREHGYLLKHNSEPNIKKTFSERFLIISNRIGKKKQKSIGSYKRSTEEMKKSVRRHYNLKSKYN